MKYRIVEKFDVDANKDLYFIQYKNDGMWLYYKDLKPQETFQEALVLLENYLRPQKVVYELEV